MILHKSGSIDNDASIEWEAPVGSRSHCPGQPGHLFPGLLQILDSPSLPPSLQPLPTLSQESYCVAQLQGAPVP